MNDMIQAEREKILSRKSTRFLFIMSILLIAAYFFFFQFNYRSAFYNYESGKMDLVSGFAAVEQRKEIAALFEGELTENTLAVMHQKIADAETITAGLDENTAFSAVHVYRDQAAILEHMTNPDGSLKSLDEAYPNSHSIILGYCDGWDKLLSGMGSVLSILICLLIVVAISPVFAEEYAYHTDHVIYSARYGRTKLVTAKVIASLETVTGMYAVFLMLHVILYGSTFGLQGWNVNIQSSLHYASSTYHLTFLQMFLCSAALNILGIAALTILTLFLSAKMNTPVSALIISCCACFLPVLFDFTDSVPLLQKAQEVCPIFMLHMNGVFAAMKTYMGFAQPIVMVIFNLVVVLIFYLLTKGTSKRHQVTG